MLSLSYAKKTENGYIMNFYADTEEDVQAFDPSADFLSYGKPLDGSILTMTGEGENINYYISSGALVPISSDSPSGDVIYDLTYSDFSNDGSYSIMANLSNFTFNPLDNWKANVSGADGVSGTGISLVYEEDDKEGNRFVADLGVGTNVSNIVLIITAGGFEGEGILYIDTKNEISSGEFTDLHVEIYK